ncbi:hypothetical protein MRB53_003859 [Persea americana]|uniref:Uncharacterized protein n=1 Tax=Persea americana TaxID=3435 RepID=A0ACC2MYS0_PERAE|nr:hypothetical protein MRB53_003859 [Persea americana]
MMVVVILLHLNCFAQYALCGLNWGYKRSQRPAIGVGLCLAVAISAPAIAGLYSILSPLGKEYELEVDQEEQNQSAFVDRSQQMHIGLKSLEKRYSFAVREDHRVVESRPTWRGGLFDLWDDISVAYLSLFCGFCVFGWNMERLGLAINIDNELVREALGVTGIVLCVFGLLYGGFWRIQMRKRFNLPENNFCCGYPSLTDCAQWLCCSMCSLAQEVRTGDFYDVVDDRLYRKQIDDSIQPTLSPLPREDGSPLFRSGPSSPLWSNTSPSRFRIADSPSPTRYGPEGQLPVVDEESSVKGGVMTPPFPASIQTKDKQMRPI